MSPGWSSSALSPWSRRRDFPSPTHAQYNAGVLGQALGLWPWDGTFGHSRWKGLGLWLFGRGTCCPCTGLTFPLHKAWGEHHGLNSSYKYSCTQKALTPWSFLPAKCLASRSDPTTKDMLPQHQLLSLCSCTLLLRRCISNTAATARCNMGVASVEKFLHWINAFCVLLLLAGVKPGTA